MGQTNQRGNETTNKDLRAIDIYQDCAPVHRRGVVKGLRVSVWKQSRLIKVGVGYKDEDEYRRSVIFYLDRPRPWR